VPQKPASPSVPTQSRRRPNPPTKQVALPQNRKKSVEPETYSNNSKEFSFKANPKTQKDPKFQPIKVSQIQINQNNYNNNYSSFGFPANMGQSSEVQQALMFKERVWTLENHLRDI
jgi:hypothetical protein